MTTFVFACNSFVNADVISKCLMCIFQAAEVATIMHTIDLSTAYAVVSSGS